MRESFWKFGMIKFRGLKIWENGSHERISDRKVKSEKFHEFIRFNLFFVLFFPSKVWKTGLLYYFFHLPVTKRKFSKFRKLFLNFQLFKLYHIKQDLFYIA